MNGHPIDPFLAAWSAASGVDGFASRLRVYDALQLPGPWSRSRLKAVLASLLVPHFELHPRFENIFEIWFLRDDAPEQGLGPVDVRTWLDELAKKVGSPPKFEPQDPQTEHEPPQTKPKAIQRPKRRWPWLLLIALCLAVVVFMWLRREKPVAIPKTQASTAASIAASAAPVPSVAPGEPTVRTYPKLEFAVTEAPAPQWKKNLVVAAIGLFLLAIAVELIAYLRRRRFDKPRVAPIRLTDETSELDFGSGSPPLPLSSAVLDRLAYRTGLMPDAELPRLNVQKTVRATAKNAGSFVPAYDPRSQTRGLSIVRPLQLEPIAEALFQCFVTGLEARGVPIHVTTGAPRWDTYELVLLFVNAEAPDDPPVDRWLTIPHLALVELRDVQSYGPEVEKLPRGVFDFDADGLYAAIDAAALQRQPPALTGTRQLDPLTKRSIEGLGGALPLAAACSLISPCDLGTVDRMRRELLPDAPFLTFQRVLQLRGVSADGPVWRFTPRLARELQERVGTDFMRSVLKWQSRRLAQLEAPKGSRAEQMLLRERNFIELQLQLLAYGDVAGAKDRTTEGALLRTVRKLESHLDEAAFERRLRERLWTLPKQWLVGRVPKAVTWRLGRIRGDASELLKTDDPSRRSRWFWLWDAAAAAAIASLLVVAKPKAMSPGFRLETPQANQCVWVKKGSAVYYACQEHRNVADVNLFESRAATGGLRDAENYTVGAVQFIGFGVGSPPVSHQVAIGSRSITVELKTAGQREPSEKWTCSDGRFEPGPGGSVPLASIVSLPTSPNYDALSQKLLKQGIATCVVREPSMSLPVHVDVAAQTYRYDGNPDEFPSQKSEGYAITPLGFWIPASNVAVEPKKPVEPNGKIRRKSIAASVAQPGSKAELLAALANVGVTKISGDFILNGMLTPRIVQWLNQLDEPISLKFQHQLAVDLTSLAGLKRLASLGLDYIDLSNISTLSGIRATSLHLDFCRLSNLSALRGMQLTFLSLSGNSVRDLSPLKGMPLRMLHINSTDVTDLSPLRDLPLEFLNLAYTQVSDLSAVKDMPLAVLYIEHTRVTDLSALKGKPLSILSAAGLENQVKDWSPVPAELRPKVGSVAAIDTNVTDTEPTDPAPADSSSEPTENVLPAAPKVPSDAGTSARSIPSAAE